MNHPTPEVIQAAEESQAIQRNQRTNHPTPEATRAAEEIQGNLGVIRAVSRRTIQESPGMNHRIVGAIRAASRRVVGRIQAVIRNRHRRIIRNANRNCLPGVPQNGRAFYV
jgi:hypothetical protein